MGRTLAALINTRSRPHAGAQRACQSQLPRVLYNQTSQQAGTERPGGRIHKMNIRQPAPTPTLVSRASPVVLAGQSQTMSSRGPLPPKGGRKVLLCGGCGGTGGRNDSDTVPSGTEFCDSRGTFYDYGAGSQVTHQIFKDTVKGNPGAYSYGSTNKPMGIYGSGSLVMREYTGSTPPPLPAMEATSPVGLPIYIVQPRPAVKNITVPARKSYAYSTSELIRKSGIGYDANLAIRNCGTRNACGAGDCGCQCGLACQASEVCDDRSYWADGVCPGGMTGMGIACTTGTGCGGDSGPCKCQSWTYKRRNGEYAANGGVDASQLTARAARMTQVADKCNTDGCIQVEGAKTPCAGGGPGCICGGLMVRTRGQMRRVPRELQQPPARRVR